MTCLKIPFLICFPIMLFSQTQLSQLYLIGDAGVSSSEIVAVRDANGEYCSGIQVISDMEGFTYNSYNGVVRVDDGKGKDMVVVSSTERVLEIYHTGYEPLKLILSEAGIQLKAGKVWILHVAGEINVFIDSSPQGAEISLNGHYLGVTPFTGKVRPGIYTVKLTEEMYHSLEDTIFLTDSDSASFVFKLIPQFGRLILTSEPTGADVFLDGSLVGKTKLELEKIHSGDHLLLVRKKPLYHDFSGTITIRDESVYKENIILNITDAAKFRKNPNTAFLKSFILPGVGMKNSSWLAPLGAVCSWAMVFLLNSSTSESKKNADYLYKIDPTGTDPDFTIKFRDDEYWTGSEWRSQEDTSRRIMVVFGTIGVLCHLWSGISGSNKAKSYNKEHGYEISYEMNARSAALVLSKHL